MGNKQMGNKQKLMEQIKNLQLVEIKNIAKEMQFESEVKKLPTDKKEWAEEKLKEMKKFNEKVKEITDKSLDILFRDLLEDTDLDQEEEVE